MSKNSSWRWQIVYQLRVLSFVRGGHIDQLVSLSESWVQFSSVIIPSQIGGSGRIHSFPWRICSFLLLDCFHPRNYGFVSSLSLTEHVQSLYWACADITDPVCDRFDGWLWIWLNSNRDIISWVLHTCFVQTKRKWKRHSGAKPESALS